MHLVFGPDSFKSLQKTHMADPAHAVILYIGIVYSGRGNKPPVLVDMQLISDIMYYTPTRSPTVCMLSP